jgi:hypothetical protein
MRKILTALSAGAIAAVAFAAPASAQDDRYPATYSTPAAIGAGAVVGTVAGVGLYEGWFGTVSSSTIPLFPATAAGAATVGGVAGIGTIALIDAAVQPCRGFNAFFGLNKANCVNGQYVSYAPPARRVR